MLCHPWTQICANHFTTNEANKHLLNNLFSSHFVSTAVGLFHVMSHNSRCISFYSSCNLIVSITCGIYWSCVFQWTLSSDSRIVHPNLKVWKKCVSFCSQHSQFFCSTRICSYLCTATSSDRCCCAIPSTLSLPPHHFVLFSSQLGSRVMRVSRLPSWNGLPSSHHSRLTSSHRQSVFLDSRLGTELFRVILIWLCLIGNRIFSFHTSERESVSHCLTRPNFLISRLGTQVRLILLSSQLRPVSNIETIFCPNFRKFRICHLANLWSSYPNFRTCSLSV